MLLGFLIIIIKPYFKKISLGNPNFDLKFRFSISKFVRKYVSFTEFRDTFLCACVINLSTLYLNELDENEN